jgi:hypothetical protein
MVKTVPLTDVSLDREGCKMAFDRAHEKLGCFFIFWAILAAPVVIALCLWLTVYAVASFVFAVQALIVGTATYQQADCQNRYGVWLIVYGSLIVASAFFSCFCMSPGKKDEDRKNPCQILVTLIGLANFGWLCYGINIVYSNPTDICNQSQYDVFRMIVMFMFWGAIAILGASLFLCCSVFPVVAAAADDFKADANKSANNAVPAQATDLEKGESVPATAKVPVTKAEEKLKTSENEQQVAAV